MDIPSLKTSFIFICILLLLVIFIYFIDLIEFPMDSPPNIEHLPPLILVPETETETLPNTTQTILLLLPPSNDTSVQPITLPISNDSNQSNISNHNHLHKKPETFSDLFSNPHHIINGNPLQFNQCKNALLSHHKLNITNFISTHLSHLSPFVQKQLQTHQNDIIFTRELLTALNQSLHYQHIIRCRISFDANNENFVKSRSRAKNEPLTAYTKEFRLKNNISKKQLIYFHISKCGSSSIHNMLNEHYNTTRMYWTHLLEIDAFKPLPDIDCAFSFVRHPIDRLISGYYTILTMQEREFRNAAKDRNMTVEMVEIEYALKHEWYNVSDKKVRFRKFVEEVFGERL